MARILLGVSGGIAAYKALELTRLAMKAGHARARRSRPRPRRASSAPASFAGITGAPGAASPSGSPTRCAAPSPATRCPEHAPLSHLALVERADVFLIAPASAQHASPSSPRGHADNLLTAAALACRAPLIVAPAMNDAMYEHAATQANLAHAARARRDRARAGRRARSARRASRASGACPSRPSCWPRSRRRSRAGARDTRRACACSSPPAARASRSTRCASSATAPPGGWASRSPRRPRAAAREVTVVAANVSLPAPAGHRRTSTWGPPPSSPPPAQRALRRRRRAADGRRRRRLPARPPRTRARSRRTQTGEELDAAARAYRGRARDPRRPPARRARCWSASPPSTARARSPTAAPSCERKGLDAVVVNDVGAPGIGFDAADNEVVIVTGRRRSGTCRRSTKARGRARHPRRGA